MGDDDFSESSSDSLFEEKWGSEETQSGVEEDSSESKELSAVGCSLPTLYDAAANVVAEKLPFEMVEVLSSYNAKPVPESVQLSIMKAAFPQNKSIIKNCAYLTQSDRYFYYGHDDMNPKKWRIEKGKQIGFTLVGKVRKVDSLETPASVAVTFDRRRITSSVCSQHKNEIWCSHVVQIIFHRIDHPSKFKYRLPISDGIQKLTEFQQKQFFCRLLGRFQLCLVGAAQSVLDDFLRESSNLPEGKMFVDPTAGGLIGDEPKFFLLHMKDILSTDENLFDPKTIGRCFDMISKNASFTSWENFLSTACQFTSEKDDDASKLRKKGFRGCLHFAKLLLRDKRESCFEVLSEITEKWLECLQRKASEFQKNRRFFLVPLSDETFSSDFDSKNNEILSSSMRSFPDQLVFCLQLAATSPNFSSAQRNVLYRKVQKWLIKLNRIVKFAMRTERMLEISKNTDRKGNDWKRLWESLNNWNGFSHVSVLLSCGAAEMLQNFVSYPVPAEAALPTQLWTKEVSLDESFLKTVSFFAVALKHFGFRHHSKYLAKVVAVSFLQASGANLTSRFDEQKKGAEKDFAEAARQLFVLRKFRLWNRDGDILTPLLTLWQIVTDLELDELWKDRSLKLKWSEESDAEGNDINLSWKVALAVECLAQTSNWIANETNEQEEVKDVNEIFNILAQHAVISEVIANVRGTEKLQLRQWLLTNLQNNRLKMSSPLLLLTLSLYDARRQEEDKTRNRLLSVSLKWLSVKSGQLCQLFEAIVKKELIRHSSLVRLHEFCTALILVLPMCSHDDGSALNTVVAAVDSPLRCCLLEFPEESQATYYYETSLTAYFVCCILQVFLSTAGAALLDGFYNYCSHCDTNLKKDLALLNLPQCSELFTCFDDQMPQFPSLDLKILVSAFLQLLPMLRFKKNYTLESSVSHMLRSLQWGRIQIGFENFLAMWEKTTGGKWTMLASSEFTILDNLMNNEEGLPDITKLKVEDKKRASLMLKALSINKESFYKLIRKMNAASVLFELALAELKEKRLSFPFGVVFWLARNTPSESDCVIGTLREKYQLVEAAFVNYNYFLQTSSKEKHNLLSLLQSERLYSRDDEKLTADDVLFLAELPCEIDQEEQKDLLETENDMRATTHLFQIVLDNWIDPLFGFAVLAQVADLALAYSIEETTKAVSSSPPKLCLTDFIAKDTATDQLRALSENSVTGSELIRRCKTSIAENLLKKRQKPKDREKSAVMCPLRSNCEVLYHDLVVLDFLCHTFPDDSPDVQQLISIPRHRLSSRENYALTTFREEKRKKKGKKGRRRKRRH